MKESEWKKFKRLRDLCLEQFCRNVLEEAQKIGDSDDLSAHDRYLSLYQLMHDKDNELGLIEAIKKLNSIRNKNAHNLDFKLKKEDVKLISNLNLELKDDVRRKLKKVKSPKEELISFCLALNTYVTGFFYGKQST